MMKIPQSGKPFLGVRFIQCNVYGRLYKNKDNTAYVGLCPKCGKPFKIAIGESGTTARFFIAKCR